MGDNKTVRREQYNKIRQAVGDLYPDVGALGMNHNLAIAATIGTHHLWCGTEIELTKSRAIKWLITEFLQHVPEPERKKIKVEDMYANIKAGLENRFKDLFTLCLTENIVCKVYRGANQSGRTDGAFFDIYIDGQNIYELRHDGVTVVPPGNKEPVKIKGTILDKVPYHGVYIPIDNLRREMASFQRPLTMQSLSVSFKDGLFDMRRVTDYELPFEVATSVVHNQWFDDVFSAAEKYVRVQRL